MVMRKNTNMRTTLDLPDEIVTEIKILAAQERSCLLYTSDAADE